jgi:hypothetical protein
MRNVPVQLLSGVDTANLIGTAVFVGQSIAGSVISTFGDATAAGTVTLQGSNEPPEGDPNQYTPSSGSFAVITGASSTIASGIGPAIVLQTMNFQYVRAVFAHSGGGSSTILVSATFLDV